MVRGRIAARVVLVLALAGTAVVGSAPAASAVTCPVVDPVTHAVTPAPVINTKWTGCVLRGADLSGAVLELAELSGTDLFGADLSGANLRSAALSRTDLRAADLTGADLTGATGSGSRLQEADLSGATITGAVFTGAAFKGWLGTGVVGTPAAPGPCAVSAGSLLCSIGMLRVVTSPAVPSVIAIDGSLTDMWGIEWMKKATGSHTICFGAVEGWTPPPCQTVDVATGAVTTVTGTFVRNGFLQVTTSPAVASRISVDGIPRDNWGIYTDLPTGSHQVCFGPVPGYLPPPCQTVELVGGATTSVTGTFTPSAGAPGLTGLGLLRVATSPATPSRISVDGNVADTWGLDWLQIEPGQHTVCFSRVLGASAGCRTVTVTAGQTTTTVGSMGTWAYFKAETNPPLPATFNLNGVDIDDWGAYTVRHTAADDTWLVCFSAVPGYVTPTPACRVPTFSNGVGSVTANYLPKP